jgi:hypothetical protein
VAIDDVKVLHIVLLLVHLVLRFALAILSVLSFVLFTLPKSLIRKGSVFFIILEWNRLPITKQFRGSSDSFLFLKYPGTLGSILFVESVFILLFNAIQYYDDRDDENCASCLNK